MSLDIYFNTHCKCCNSVTEVYSCNITHNLSKMASVAGLHGLLWGMKKGTIAYNLIPRLKKGIRFLENNKSYCESFNPKNSWGDYNGLLKVTREILVICEKNPKAKVEIWK